MRLLVLENLSTIVDLVYAVLRKLDKAAVHVVTLVERTPKRSDNHEYEMELSIPSALPVQAWNGNGVASF